MNFDDIAKTAKEKASDLEPWDRYYALRAAEMKALFAFYAPKRRGMALETGSGLGFNALMIDRVYQRTVATDLYREDSATHTLGVEKTGCFLSAVPHRSIDVVSCLGERLSFRDASFDAVFAIYTMEHVKDRDMAMTEMRRVLKNKGEAIIVVPGFLERLFYPLSFYRDLLNSALSRLMRVNKSKSPITNHQSPITRTSFFRRYPHFPFPEPHGEYPNFFAELAHSTPFEWIALAKRSGLKIKLVFTTMIFPKELSSLLIGSRTLNAYIKTIPIINRLGNKVFLKYCGQNLCMVLEKNE